jgi:hypothetical protein
MERGLKNGHKVCVTLFNKHSNVLLHDIKDKCRVVLVYFLFLLAITT